VNFDDDVIRRCRILAGSFERLVGRPLLPRLPAEGLALAQALYDAPVVIVSHGTEADPVFWFANRAAQALWEMDWATFTRTPSRLSAEPDERATREALLRRAAEQGFIDDYRGVRVSASGRRFLIEDVVLWNLADEAGARQGQAATFSRWRYLEP
jgi:MEKHLA domain